MFNRHRANEPKWMASGMSDDGRRNTMVRRDPERTSCVGAVATEIRRVLRSSSVVAALPIVD